MLYTVFIEYLQRHRMAAVVAHDALRFARGARRCRGYRADRWRRPARSRPAAARCISSCQSRSRPGDHRGLGLRSREHDDASAAGTRASSSAASTSGLYSTTRVELEAAAGGDQQLGPARRRCAPPARAARTRRRPPSAPRPGARRPASR